MTNRKLEQRLIVIGIFVILFALLLKYGVKDVPIKEVKVVEIIAILEEPILEGEILLEEEVIPQIEKVDKPITKVVEVVVDKTSVESVSEPLAVVNHTKDDLYWLSRIISAEARGESTEGQIAVGNVVMNRVRSEQFPNTIYDVIFQKGQFSPVSNGSINREPNLDCVESAQRVLNGEVVVSNEALYFYAPKYVSRSNWIRSRVTLNEIGVHRFAK